MPDRTFDTTALVRVIRHEAGPRLYVRGLRVHHGLTGAVMLSCAVLARAAARPLVCTIALSLMVHDLHDFPWALREATVTD